MAARKLQTEIDRTLKKVAEGVELFESIYEKMQASTNQTQKEKLEMDLKTQIKKLQRLRDQIKTWVASNDIKDKSSLLENRRLIETQMEKFKACEKEMKTKAFSKEGLIQAARLDPKEQEKEEAMSWLQAQVEELQMQVESAEAEVESLQGAGKKRNKAGSTAAGRLEELENLNERRKWHISRLEIVLRLLNNGSLSTDKVIDLKEDVTYFVESNTDDGFEEDEGIYDDLNLDEEEEKFGLVPEDNDSSDSDEASEDVPQRTPSKKHDEESVASSKRDDSPILKKATVSVGLRTKPPPPNPNFVQQPMASIVKAGLPPRPSAPAAMPPIRYAAAAAAAVAPTNAQSSTLQTSASSTAPTSIQTMPLPSSIPSSSSQLQTADQQSRPPSSPSLTHPSVISPILSSASVSNQPDGSFYSGQESPALSEAVPGSVGAPAATSSPQTKGAVIFPKVIVLKVVLTLYLSDSASIPPRAASQSPSLTQKLATELPPTQTVHQPSTQSGVSPLPQQLQQYTTPASGSPQPPQTAQPQFPPGVKAPTSEATPTGQPSLVSKQQQRPPSTSTAFPGSLSDLVVSFESVKQKAANRMTNLDQVHKMLEGGHSNVPQPQDTEKPKYYVPRHPFQTASYYPQSPHPALSTPAIFSQLDVETLFYVFYFLPGTYQQYLAAKELKRQSWRFHVKYLTWFQRHSEPQAITEEYEQGVYVYFDWEGSWCQRKKSDFRFEYRYLSED
ncbi:hypothetical protein H0H93_000278 [Arthromyces matolae]|nr:hypothetical protein H0H93_000278 [Arthromyces matolae]